MKKKLVGLLTGLALGAGVLAYPSTAHAKTDSAGNKIIMPTTKSHVALKVATENETHKEIDTKTLDTLVVTPIGGFAASYSDSSGKQAIDPHMQNIVTNGSRDRDEFALQSGKIWQGSVGYGFKHLIVGDCLDISFKIGYGKGAGNTDIGNTVTGHMSREEIRRGGQLALMDIMNDIGIKVSYLNGDRRDGSRFADARSIEDIDTRRTSLEVSFPILEQKLTAGLFASNEKESSDVQYVDITPGGMLIPREVAHDKDEVGLSLKLYHDFMAQRFAKIAVSAIDGGQRHEFTTADVNGYRIQVQLGGGNDGQGHYLEPEMLLTFEMGHTRSESYCEYPSAHPLYGPLTMQFNESKGRTWAKISMRKAGDWNVELGHEIDVKEGSTDALVQAMGIVQPYAAAELKTETITLDGLKELGPWAVGGHAMYELEEKDKSFRIDILYRF